MTEIRYSLNIDEALIAGLGEPDDGARFLVLNEIGVGTVSTELREKLVPISQNDPSEICRQKAREILASEENRKKAQEVFNNVELTPEVLGAVLEGAADLFRDLIMVSKRKAPPPELLDQWRTHLLEEIPAEVHAVGLGLLARFGSSEDASFALSALSKYSCPILVHAALDLMHFQKPQIIPGSINGILSGDDIDLKLHALRVWQHVDPFSALCHLHEFLESPDPQIRQKGLRELILFPFEESESTVLAFISRENQPILLIIAGADLAMNPHPDLPLKIFDIHFLSRGTKKNILNLVLKQTIESIHQAGILREPVETYIASLKERLQTRKNRLVIEICLQQLANEDPEIRREGFTRLKPFLDDPAVKGAIKRKGLSLPAEFPSPDPGSPSLMSPRATPTVVETDFPLEDFSRLSPDEQIKSITLLGKPETFSRWREKLGSLLKTSLPRQTLIGIIQIFRELGAKSDGELLLPALNHEEPGVVANALRALTKINPDLLLPRFQKHLKSDDPRVKVAAVEFCLTCDKEAAIGVLKSMLSSFQNNIRQNALSMVPLLDICIAQPLLIEAIHRETQADLRRQMASLLAVDPTLDGLATLWGIIQTVSAEEKASLQEMFEMALPLSIPALSSDVDSLRQVIASRYQRQKAAVAELGKTKRLEAENKRQEQLQKEAEEAPLFEKISPIARLAAGGSLLLITLLAGSWLFGRAGPSNPERKSKAVKTDFMPKISFTSSRSTRSRLNVNSNASATRIARKNEDPRKVHRSASALWAQWKKTRSGSSSTQ